MVHRLKKSTAAVLAAAVLFSLSGCRGRTPRLGRYEASFLTLFDTVTTVVGYAEGKDAFMAEAQLVHDELEQYHQRYDIYNDYDGLNNIKTINDNAGVAPVTVDAAIIELLLEAKEMEHLTGGKVNVAMGSVLSIWHDYREAGIDSPQEARLPPMELLQAAASHTDIDDVVINEENRTVYLADPEMSLDVGAIAKGYATQRVCNDGREWGITSMLISVGGNVCAIGANGEGRPWRAGLQDPDGGEVYLHTVPLADQTLVTSGSYQRYYTVNGRQYHHIIDPDTLMPADYFTAVTVLADDSGGADAMSTALFNLPYEAGLALVQAMPRMEAIWVMKDGTQQMTEGFSKVLKQ